MLFIDAKSSQNGNLISNIDEHFKSYQRLTNIVEFCLAPGANCLKCEGDFTQHFVMYIGSHYRFDLEANYLQQIVFGVVLNICLKDISTPLSKQTYNFFTKRDKNSPVLAQVLLTIEMAKLQKINQKNFLNEHCLMG